MRGEIAMAMKIFGRYIVYVYDHAEPNFRKAETVTCFDNKAEAVEIAQEYAGDDGDGSALIAVYQLVQTVRDPEQDLTQDEGVPS
jgi:hypothetical protein